MTIPRLQLSQEQLERLRKLSSKHQKAPIIVNKEDDKENVATVNASASSTVSTTETVSTETSTMAKEPVTTVEESPTRHRLTNLLDGSSLSPNQDSAAQTNEENVNSIDCTRGGQLNNAEGLPGPVKKKKKKGDKENDATVNASTSSTASATETVSTETSTIVKEPVTTVEESPTRHRLTNLLDGSSLSPYQDSAAHTNEENVNSIDCTRGGQLNNAEGLPGPVKKKKKEDDKENVATVNASASSTASATETVSTEASTIVKEPVTTVEESPTRHRLANLLDGSSLSPYQGSAAHTNEENVNSIDCTRGGQLNNAEGLPGPVSAEETLFCPEDLLSSDNGLSPLMHEKDCITIPCDPDVVTKTIMQVEIGCTQTSSDNGSQAANAVTASVQDKEEDYEANQRVQPTSVEEVPNVPEEENDARNISPGSCDVLGQLSNNARPDRKEAENGNAEGDSGVMSTSAEAHVQESMIDYASHYDTLEVCRTFFHLSKM